MKNALSEKWTGAEFHSWVWRLFSKSLYNKFKASISKLWCSPVAHTHKKPLSLSKKHTPWAPTPAWKVHTPSRRWTLEHTWSSQLFKTDYSTSQQPVRNKKVYSEEAALTQSCCVSAVTLPQTIPNDSSHFQFHADNSEHDKCWYLSTLILVLLQTNIDKDYLKLGQGLELKLGQRDHSLHSESTFHFWNRKREKSDNFRWQLFQQ